MPDQPPRPGQQPAQPPQPEQLPATPEPDDTLPAVPTSGGPHVLVYTPGAGYSWQPLPQLARAPGGEQPEPEPEPKG